MLNSGIYVNFQKNMILMKNRDNWNRAIQEFPVC